MISVQKTVEFLNLVFPLSSHFSFPLIQVLVLKVLIGLKVLVAWL